MLERRKVLVSCAIASFLTPFSSSSVTVLLPQISSHFGISLAASNWSAGAYLIPLAAFIVPFGRIADWKGRGSVFLVGLVLFSISSLLAAISSDFASFLIFRSAQGIASSMISATAVAVISEIFPREGRGRAIGVNTASVYIGLSLGPLLGGLIADLLSWAWVFVLSSLISLSALLLSGQLLRLRGGSSSPSFALISLYTVSMILLTYGISSLGDRSGILASSIGALLLMLWLSRETLRGGLVGPQLLKNRAYLASSTAALLNYSATYAISIVLSLHLQRVLGLSASEAGIILTMQPVVQALLSPLAGYLADKSSPHKIASLGMIVVALGIATLLPLTPSEQLTSLLISLSILGMGFALFASPNTVAALNASPQNLYGSANAFLGSMRFLGQSLSTSILMMLMAQRELLQAINMALSIYVLISVAGAIISAVARYRSSLSEEDNSSGAPHPHGQRLP